jgi:hypothetical protein
MLIPTFIAALIAAAPPPPVFDFVCKGETQYLSADRGTETGPNWAGTIHIDLVAGTWCADSCATRSKIQNPNDDGQIVLRSTDEPYALTVADPAAGRFLNTQVKVVNGVKQGTRLIGECTVKAKAP